MLKDIVITTSIVFSTRNIFDCDIIFRSSIKILFIIQTWVVKTLSDMNEYRVVAYAYIVSLIGEYSLIRRIFWLWIYNA